MGLIFLWAFFDKLLGLGYATTADKSWLNGGSPTTGFLQFGVHGPFTDFFHSLAGSGTIDFIFMLGLLFIGIALTLGIFMKLGSWSGMLMLFLMYLAVGIAPTNHPFIDDHFIYILVILVLLLSRSENYIGFGMSWANKSFVQKHRLLK